MSKHLAPLAAALLLLGTQVPAIGQAAPDASSQRVASYLVRPGDTLWGIAARFLKNPWEWPKLWQANPQIHNPNLIYPGDQIQIYRLANGTPAVRILHQIEPALTVHAIPSYHLGVIMPFLQSPAVIANPQAYAKLPYLAEARDHRPVYTADDRLYTSGLTGAALGTRYDIVRLGTPLYRLGDSKLLGYTLQNLGTAEIVRAGKEAEVRITSARREISLGDRLVPVTQAPTPHYFPSAPEQAVAARIVAKMNNAEELTVGQVVVLDQGANAKLQPGNVLEIYDSAEMGKNAVTGKNFPLPPRKIGTLMVFRVFPEVSYAVITAAQRGITLGADVYYPVAGPAELREEAQLTP
ncbi:MAG: LysM peptidoglycan-binding domain-containing protein [Acidithiobacillus sp.]|nr:LysM peptidoglycan-binding domain-containing protein [Acidithiobacillus sp.]